MPDMGQPIIWPATIAGLLHVILGPDHLSAIMTMSVFGRSASFWRGIRWGIGHSLGIAIVALFVFIIGESLSAEAHAAFDYWGSIFSGFFMIGLGIHFLKKAPPRIISVGNSFAPFKDEVDDVVVPSILGRSPTHRVTCKPTLSSPSSSAPSPNLDHYPILREGPLYVSPAHTSTPLLSLVSGVIGGAAGPGALLAILPASYYPDAASSVAYISVFVLVSTIMMGLVAMGYGEMTYRMSSDGGDHAGSQRDDITEPEELGNQTHAAGNHAKNSSSAKQRMIYVFSAGISVAVGVAWVALTLAGVLGTGH